MQRMIGSMSLAVLVSVVGCGGGVMKSYTMREARNELATHNAPCEAKDVKSEIVREITDRPKDVDYLAIVHVKGCGTEANYLCGNYLCNEGNYCNAYKCEPAK